MRKEIDDKDLERIAGGTVYISRDKNKIGFSTTWEQFELKDCTFRQAQNLAEDLWEANQSLGDKDFDALVKKEFQGRGWI